MRPVQALKTGEKVSSIEVVVVDRGFCAARPVLPTLNSTRKRNIAASNKDLGLSNPAFDRDRNPNRKVTQEDKWLLGSCKQKRPMKRLHEWYGGGNHPLERASLRQGCTR